MRARDTSSSPPSSLSSLSPRWRKLVGDIAGERGRIAAMIVGVAVSVTAVGAVLGAYAILTREIRASYLGTRPAAATLEIPGGIDAEMLARVRADADVDDAEARGVIVARAHVGDDWRPLLLFVVDDFASLRLNTFTRESGGAWPPPPGTMLIERSAAAMLGLTNKGDANRSVLVKTPHGESERAVAVSGVVHDPGLAPAWQEREGYGYITRDTAMLLGEDARLEELRIGLRAHGTDDAHGADDAAGIEARALRVAERLVAASAGVEVHQVRVPPPLMHPHQKQMTVILTMMSIFAALALVLSAILVATSLSAMLARQVREIGVMKTLGASGAQIGAMYVVLVVVIGAVSALIAVPIGVEGARVFARAVSAMLNFDVATFAEPAWVFVVQVVAGIAVPVLVALVPVTSAARATVRDALDRHGAVVGGGIGGIGGGGGGGMIVMRLLRRLPRPLRDALRRPKRLALTLALLSAGGAMFMAALDVKESWRATLAKIPATRFYDVEVRLHAPASPELEAALRALDDVAQVETWGATPAAFAARGRIDVVHTYPDRGHGSLQVLVPPSSSTTLVRYPVLAGRWLAPSDAAPGAPPVVVLNHAARAAARAAQQRPVDVGDEILVSLDGALAPARVVGVVEEIGAAGIVYANPALPAAARAQDAVDGRVLRIAFGERAESAEQKAAMVREVEAVLAAQHAAVDVVMPLEELRTAIGDHILILVNALSALAAIMAIVGVLGLATTIGISVVERTREIGVVRTLGATPARVRRSIVAEAIAVALASVVFAVALSLPLALLLDVVVGRLGFLAPLDFLVDGAGVAAWTAIVLVAAAAAAFVPAKRAATIRPRDALTALA